MSPWQEEAVGDEGNADKKLGSKREGSNEPASLHDERVAPCPNSYTPTSSQSSRDMDTESWAIAIIIDHRSR